MDPDIVAAYDAGAETYATHRDVRDPEPARRFARQAPPGRRLDLGCGPGLYFTLVGRPLIATDVSPAMLAVAHRRDATVPLVCADLEHLPFADGAFAGIWANKCLQHVERATLAPVLADLHRILASSGRLIAEAFAGSGWFRSDDDLPGRAFTLWQPEDLHRLLLGAGFSVERCEQVDVGNEFPRVFVEAVRGAVPREGS